MFKYKLSEEVLNFIKDCNLTEIKIGCSDSQVFQIVKDDKTYYLKVSKKGLLTQEYHALLWLNGKLLVPKIVMYNLNGEVEVLITEAIKGDMVCSKKMLKKPDLGIKIIAQAFQQLYSLDYKDCPFNVNLDYKLNLITDNVEKGLIHYEDFPTEVKEKYKSPEEVLNFLKKNRFEEELCFSHGDVSLPNIFCNRGKFSGFIDVGECGIADKWFDLAICQKSIIRNFGEEYVEKFYQELGIIPDYTKINYYLLMMELYL